jgi:hypothetical protein
MIWTRCCKGCRQQPGFGPLHLPREAKHLFRLGHLRLVNGKATSTRADVEMSKYPAGVASTTCRTRRRAACRTGQCSSQILSRNAPATAPGTSTACWTRCLCGLMDAFAGATPDQHRRPLGPALEATAGPHRCKASQATAPAMLSDRQSHQLEITGTSYELAHSVPAGQAIRFWESQSSDLPAPGCIPNHCPKDLSASNPQGTTVRWPVQPARAQ